MLSTHWMLTWIVIVILANLTIVTQAKVVLKVRDPLTTTTEPPPPKFKCNCGDAPHDLMICANDGSVYTSSCHFHCAQQDDPYLRIVKTGTCQGVTVEEYYRASAKKP